MRTKAGCYNTKGKNDFWKTVDKKNNFMKKSKSNDTKKIGNNTNSLKNNTKAKVKGDFWNTVDKNNFMKTNTSNNIFCQMYLLMG